MISTYLLQKVLVEYDGFFFIPLASRLVNEDSTKCKKRAAQAIKSLLTKVCVLQLPENTPKEHKVLTVGFVEVLICFSKRTVLFLV